MRTHKPGKPAKKVMLALQGGGAHGAFTWGVLDQLLEDGMLDVVAISGTSAGAMNAVVMAEGLIDGGPEAARAQLERFWRAASLDGSLSSQQRSLFGPLMGAWGEAMQGWTQSFAGALTQNFSPYTFNPLNVSPLKDFLDKEIEFDKVRAHSPINLFIAATNVHTGKVRLFTDKELHAEHVMASACLPMMFQAVEIDGEPYWDGGYMGNPALFPLFDEPQTDDVILVQINPVKRALTPHSVQEIHDRLNEITFNATLLHEMRAIEFVHRLIDQGKLSPTDYKKVLMHRISLHDVLGDLTAASKLETDWAFLKRLRDAGRKAMQHWMTMHYDDLGKVCTIDLKAEFS